MNEEADNARRLRFLTSHHNKRKELSQAECIRIFDEEILPSILTGDRRATNRTFVAVGSQPGGGKSTMVRSLKDRFDGERTISISMDDFFHHLPGFNEARMKGGRWEETLQHEDDTISEWGKMAIDYALKNKTHLITETCKDPKSMGKYYKQKGYNTELYIIATDKHTSLTSIFSRAARGFENHNMANCAVLSKKSHDGLYAQWPRIALEVEAGGSFDKIGIATRERGVCYENKMITRRGFATQYDRSPEAHREIIKLNNGPFTQAKVDQLKKNWNEVFQSPLAGLRELKSLPLKQYQNSVMSRVESAGAQFRPNVILPKDRAAERHAYMTLLHEDLSLINDHLDLGERNDHLLSTELIRTLAEFDSWASQKAMNLNLCHKLEVCDGSSGFITCRF